MRGFGGTVGSPLGVGKLKKSETIMVIASKHYKNTDTYTYSERTSTNKQQP